MITLCFRSQGCERDDYGRAVEQASSRHATGGDGGSAQRPAWPEEDEEGAGDEQTRAHAAAPARS